MRICLVSREFAPYFGAGIGTFAAHMFRALSDAGHEVHVLTALHPGMDAHAGDRVHTFQPLSGRDGAIRFDSPAIEHALGVHRALTRLHAEHGFEYIEFPDFGAEAFFCLRARRVMGAYAGAVLGVRLHMPQQLIHAKNSSPWLSRAIAVQESCEAQCLREADVLIAPCRDILDQIAQMPAPLAGLDVSRVGVAPQPFVPGLLSPAHNGAGGPNPSAPPEPAGSPEPPTILHFGRLEPRKGAHVLLDACLDLLERGKDLRLSIVGSDAPDAILAASMVESLHAGIPDRWRERISIEPGIPREHLAARIDHARVCCFPALWDNAPYALIEAMARGACVVASSVGGLGEIARDGVDALLCPPGDALALARSLDAALSDSALRERLSQGSRTRIAEYCAPEPAAQATVELVERARSRPGWCPTSIGTSNSAARDSRSPEPDTPSDRPAISVVIPHYNLDAFLPETLDSLATQTMHDFEVVIVDDGSTRRRSRSLLDRIARQGWPGLSDHPRAPVAVRVFSQPNRGPSAARNLAIAHAKGEWIVPLDADDLLTPDALALLLGGATRESADAATGIVSEFEESPDAPTGGWVPIGFDRDLLSVVNIVGTGSGVLMRRESVLRAGGYDERLPAYEDWDLYQRLAKLACRCSLVPEVTCLYRVRAGSRMAELGRPHHARLLAALLARNADLPENPDRAARILLASMRRTQVLQQRRLRVASSKIRRLRGRLRARRRQHA